MQTPAAIVLKEKVLLHSVGVLVFIMHAHLNSQNIRPAFFSKGQLNLCNRNVEESDTLEPQQGHTQHAGSAAFKANAYYIMQWLSWPCQGQRKVQATLLMAYRQCPFR